MAKTITLNLSAKIAADPGAPFQQSVSGAGAGGRALQQLGQAIVQTGVQVGSVVERRRAEEDRDTISTQKATDKFNSASEFEVARERFVDNPIGMADALSKAQKKRQDKALKGIESPTARARMQKEFELSRLENRLAAVSFERTQFTKNSIRNIADNAKLKAQSDFESPVSIREFLVDLDTDLELDLESRDLDILTKDKLKESITETRVNGLISGYLRGGEIQDFTRAKELVKKLDDRITPEQADKLNRKIDSERIRQQNVKAFNERQERTSLKKQFEKEQNNLRDIFQAVIDNPDADVTDEIKKFKSFGHIPEENFVVVSREKMTPEQRDTSQSLMISTLDQLADSENVTDIRNTLYQNTFSGQLSVEDAETILTSIQIRSDSQFKRSEYKFADNLLRNSVTSGFSFNKQVNREQLNQMVRDRDLLVKESGLDPATASQVILKERGKNALPGIGKVRSLKSNQDTIKGLDEARNELAGKIRNKKIPKEEALEAMDILDRREDALLEVPTLKDLREKK